MKKISKNFIQIVVQGVLIVIILFSLAPIPVVYAQAKDESIKGEYTMLAPLPGTTKDGCTKDCKTDWSTYLPGAFKFIIGLAAGLAFVMITFGGIVYATSDAITGKSQGREYIENALWGLGLVIGAWVILNTINPNILNFNLNVPKPNLKYGSATIVAGVPMGPGDLSADQQVRDRLKTAGIDSGNPPCKEGETRGCTNFNGLSESTLNAVLALRNACGTSCGIRITGATENGHTVGSCHNNGTCVDIAPNAGLNTYLGFPTPNGNNNSQVPSQVTKNGCKYTYEQTGDNGASTGAHWHTACN